MASACFCWDLLATSLAAADQITDPGAPLVVPTAPFTAVILDDSLSQPGVVENYVTLLPAPTVEGDLVLLETDNLAFVVQQAAQGILHPEFWSDIVHFRNDPNLGPLANILSLDQFTPNDLTSPNVLYIVEAAFPPPADTEGVGGFSTTYLAGLPQFANVYHIESVRPIPEPGSIALIGLGGVVLIGDRICRRRKQTNL